MVGTHEKGIGRGLVSEVEVVMVGGRWPVGRSERRWRECVMEDMNLLGIQDVAQNHHLWKAAIDHSTPHLKWENANIK
ncbi:hypothetical protein E2C01_102431 [Portunus trituberculatus]|uniref:Uncharacterized protein n=1 Tax=Portunus trituberculatus TaxID=210409 RepID=A0A5B7KCK9_PORTR|nr:hypothetical protein [Portunus trituberculatus]